MNDAINLQKKLVLAGHEIGRIDGIVGPRTRSALLAAGGEPPELDLVPRHLGLFVDWRLPEPINAPAWAQELADLGITEVCVCPDHSDDGKAQVPFATGTLAAALGALVTAGLRTHIMFWIGRTPAEASDVARVARPIVERCGLRSVLLDAEERWMYKAPEIEAHRAANGVRRELSGVRLGVTGYGSLVESVRPLAAVADYCVSQAYSYWDPADPWTTTRQAAPGVLQGPCIQSWRSANSRVIAGLGAYKLRRPDMPAGTALARSHRGALWAGARRHWYWSEYFVRRDPVVREFLRAAGMEVRRGRQAG